MVGCRSIYQIELFHLMCLVYARKILCQMFRISVDVNVEDVGLFSCYLGDLHLKICCFWKEYENKTFLLPDIFLAIISVRL